MPWLYRDETRVVSTRIALREGEYVVIIKARNASGSDEKDQVLSPAGGQID